MAVLFPMLPNFICHLLFLSCILPIAHCEMFSALIELEQVLHVEQDLANDIKSYIAKEEDRLSQLRRIADDYEQHSVTALKDVATHLANPVNAFLLVKRFTSDWENVQTLIRTNSSEDFMRTVSGKTDSFPTFEDLDGAATALLRLQDTYKLSTAKIAKGEIKGVKYSPHLTAYDCFELGRLAYNNGDFYHTMLWMQESLDVWDDEDIKTMSKSTILDYLSYASSRQGNIEQALTLTNEFLTLEPTHMRARNNKRYYEKLIAEQEVTGSKKGDKVEIKNERVLDEYRDSEEFRNYEALCRGEDIIPNPYEHKLYCHYIKPHPFFILRPLKEEIAYFDPYIVLLHDILTETEMDLIKELATPKLNRATVQNPQTGVLETATYRVSKSAWLKDIHHPRIKRLSKKIDYFTGLSMETAEELQVVNYGIGGHYEPHFDFARKRERNTFEDWRGNRICTVLFYMSDVEAGGATVFTSLGVKLFPVKGAAAFWHNLKKSGEGDYRTRHAACPVLTGSKWVSNKWVHERSQEFRRPCSKNGNE